MPPTTTVKRSLVKTFLNTGTSAVPIWSLIGDGATTGTINYNPKTLEEFYISQDTGSTLVESYKPILPIEATAKVGDTVFAYVDKLRKDRAVLAAAQTEIVNVWLYETPALNEYPAERQPVSVAIEEFGGAGGSVIKIKYSVNYLGDAIKGTFNPGTLAFTPSP